MSEETKNHLTRADELLAVAEENLHNNHPADSVSRAYYAMFHAATAVLLMEGIERSSHKGIISAFGETFIKSGRLEKRFHEYFRAAFDARAFSDYFPSPPVQTSQAEETLSNAKAFVAACRAL
ncbi:MAG: HEPN domain-containing protein [Nitrospinae bacterium]|nr:HEPN domain-containing protein [Nitrospinota bacterium]